MTPIFPFVVCGIWLTCGPIAVAESLPTKGITDSRIRSAVYRDDQVYRLIGFVGYAIELVFG